MANPDQNQRTWLILAHCFNMDGRAASQTITDKLPSLMAADIRPVVLSAPTGDRDGRFPHYQVISPVPSGILFELRHIIKKRFQSRGVEKGLKAVLTIACLPFLILEKLLLQLDSQWSWFISATLKGSALVKQFEPELIYSTAGPPSTHAAGYLLHRLTGKPWLAEVHDPLIQDVETPRWHNYYFKKWLEKKIWEHAAAVIYFTQQARQSAQDRNGERERAFVLRPGALVPDLSAVRYARQATMHIGHFGSLAAERNLGGLIKALHALLAENPAWKDFLKLDIFGGDLDAVSLDVLRHYPLEGLVACHGRLEYDPATEKSGRQQVLEAMCQTDVLLLVHGLDAAAGEYIPSKLYEYLLVGRPILGLVASGSELEGILRSSGHYCVDQTDQSAVKQAVAAAIHDWLANSLRSPQDPSAYTVESTVGKLIEIADGIC